MKAFLCIHGFGHHPGGRRPGFSESLRRGVEARLGAPTVWREVLWDGLLGSPDSFGTMDLMLQTPALVRSFYEGREGDAVRARAAFGRVVFSVIDDHNARGEGNVKPFRDVFA